MVPELTRRRALAALATIGSGAVLGRQAVVAARGAEVGHAVSSGDRSVPVRWELQPAVGAGDHGPIVDLAGLQSSPRRLIVRVDVDDRPVQLALSGCLEPSTTSVDAVSAVVWASTTASTDAARTHSIPSERVHASGSVSDVFGIGSGSACGDGFVLDPEAHSGQTAEAGCYPGSRTYTYGLELASADANASATPIEGAGPFLELSFDATSCSNHGRDDGSRSTDETVRRNRNESQTVEGGASLASRSK